MADRGGQQQQNYGGGPMEGMKNMIKDKGPTTSQVVAVVTLLPIGGILLALSGMTLTGTVIALAVATPLFILFSPILVPAALVIALAVTGFLASGAFGLTALLALSSIINYARRRKGGPGSVQEQLEQAKRRMAEAAGHAGQRAKDIGQRLEGKTQDTSRA